jgi:hypothetical protein
VLLRCSCRRPTDPEEAEFTSLLVVSWTVVDLPDETLWVIERPPCITAAERFDLGSIVGLAA